MRVLPTLPTDLTKARTSDLLSYLGIKLNRTRVVYSPEEGYPDDAPAFIDYDERLSDITTELIRRHEEDHEPAKPAS